MSHAEQTFLFFMKCPKLESLLSFSVELSYDSKKKGLLLFHRRILKCRELVFSESELVATPANFSRSEIVVVMPKNKFCSQEFQKKLDKMELKVLKIGDASPMLLQECLRFTAVAKLAPQWNNVQNLLVQGRDFLMDPDPLRAIKFDIFVDGAEITLSVIPKCIKLPHFKVETYAKLYNFSGNVVSIQESCRVLPSLKKGNAISLSKSVFTPSVFKNYSDIKKHWKNMYGYRLPEIPDDDIWYVNVVFNVPFSSSAYTYPSFCIRPFGMTEIPRVDPQLTLHSFIIDFCKKVQNVCKEKCEILDYKASFPSIQLYPAQEVTRVTVPRIGTTYTMEQNIPYRNSAITPRKNEILTGKAQRCAVNLINMLPRINENSANSFTAKITQIFPSITKDQKCKITSNMSYNMHNPALQSLTCTSKDQDSSKNASLKTVVELCNDDKEGNNNLLNNRSCNAENESETTTNRNCQLQTVPIDNTASQPKYAPKFFPLKPKQEKSNYSEVNILQATEIEEKPQVKYAPKFLPKKPKQRNFTSTEVYPEIKSTKHAPNFSADKENRSSRQCVQNPNECERSDFKSNSDQLSDSTIFKKGKIQRTNSKIVSLQGDAVIQKNAKENKSSRKRMKDKQKSDDSKTQKNEKKIKLLKKPFEKNS